MDKRVVQFIIWCLSSLLAAQAQSHPGYDELRGRVDAFLAAFDSAEGVAFLASPEAMALLPMTERSFETAAVDPMPQASVQLIDLRVALVQLSIFAGTNDQLLAVRAQSAADPQVIAIQDGTIGLAEIEQWVAGQPEPDQFWRDGVLRVPLVVLEGARLVLSEGDTLRLGREDGAFLLNLGTLVIDHGAIVGTGDMNPRAEDFAPFVVTAGSGIARISHARVESLGFGKTAAFSGLSVVNKGLYQPIGTSFIADSVLYNVGMVTFVGSGDVHVQGNIFTEASHASLVLNNTSGVEVLNNVFTGSGGSGAITVTDGAVDSLIAGNMAFENAGAGILVTRGSVDTVVRDNILVRNDGVGLTVLRSDCTLAGSNTSMENGKKGIELRASRRSAVVANGLYGNRSAGLLIADQPMGNETRVARNAFVQNRVGLASASAHVLNLSENDFSDQFPRLVEGDLSGVAHQIIGDLTGSEEIQLVVGGVEAFRSFTGSCSFEQDG